jgi:hypothetical protein
MSTLSRKRPDRSSRVPRWGAGSLLLVWFVLGCQVLFGGVTVTTNDTNDDAECNVGDSRCNGEYLLSCDSQATGWALKKTCASGDLCDAKDKRCSVCNDGDFRCSGADRQQCSADGSEWKTVQTCNAENLCSESSCDGCKTDGQLDCSVAPQLRQCQGGVWVVLDTCVSQSVCEATTTYVPTAGDAWNHKCLAPGCDPAGKYKCDGAILKRCPPDQSDWVVVDTCDNEGLCAAAVTKVETATDMSAIAMLDMCKPACLNPGAYMCNGASLQQCKLDQTGFDEIKVCPADTECDPIAGDCGQLCTPGNFQCNGATLRKCGSNGHWADQAKCETSALCAVGTDGATGSCTPSRCVNAAGQKQDNFCKGAVLQKCKDDRTDYEDQLTCVSAPLCDAESARCIEPTCLVANGYQCFGQDLKQCSADQTKWNPITTCPTGQFCNSGTNPGCLTACPANPVRCNGKVLEHCDATTGWTTQATCSTPDLCNCAITDPDGAGPLTNSCALGLYKDGCGNVLCGGTLAGYQCHGAELQKCQAGRNGWDNVADCGANNLCYPGEKPSYAGGYCLTCPTAGELYCMSSVLKVCSSDRRTWNTSQTCGISCVAVPNGQDYCAACKPNAVQCSSNILQVCPSDQKAWTNTTCNSAALCDATNKQCDVCTQNVCSGKVLQKCTNGGQTVQSQTCASVCDATNGQCDACSANSYWCDGAKLNKCSADGQTFTTTTCATAALCDAANKVCQTPACSVGEHRCTGANLEVCNAARNNFDPLATCASAALCDKTKSACVPQACILNQKQCSGAQPQICKTDLTAFTNNGAACASAALCGGSTFSCTPPTCMLNDKKCSGSQPQICNTDLTKFVNNGTACASAALCNSTTFTCDPKACSAADKKCKGAQPQVCNSDLTSYINSGMACASAALCDPVTFTCDAVACTVGQHQCKGTNSQVCNADQTAFVDGTACTATGCNAMSGLCYACAMNDQKCSADGNVLTCKADQSGYSTTVCMFGCTGGQCNAPPPVCTPLAYQCAGAMNLDLSQCKADGSAWGPVTHCSTTCDSTMTPPTCDGP